MLWSPNLNSWVNSSQVPPAGRKHCPALHQGWHSESSPALCSERVCCTLGDEVETGAGSLITGCSRPEGDRLGTLCCTNSTSNPCQGHLRGQRSSGLAFVFSDGALCSCSLHTPSSAFLLPTFRMGRCRPRGEVEERRERVFLLWEASQPAKLFSAAQGSQGTQLQAAAEGDGGPTIGGGPELGLGVGVNVHRLSVPTRGQVALQGGPVFTCLLSQVAQTRGPFRSSGPGAGPGVPDGPHPHFPTLRPYAPCWGSRRSKQQQTRHRKVTLVIAERPGHTPSMPRTWLGVKWAR